MEAEVLYPRAVSILEDLRLLEDEISSVGKSVSGNLVIGASTIPSAFILPRLAAEFKEKYPKICFEIRSYDSMAVARNVENHELLLGIVGAEIPSPKLEYQPFAEDTLTLIASSSRKNKKRITLEELKKMDFLIREEGSGTRKSLEQCLLKLDVRLEQLQTRAILGSSTAIKEAVQADLGVSIISGYAIKDAVAAKLLDIIEIEGVTMKRNFFIVTPKRRSLPHHYSLFLNHLLQSGLMEK